MKRAQLDSFPVGELQHRYKVCSLPSTRLEALNIKPEKQGGKGAYVNEVIEAVRCCLHDHIEQWHYRRVCNIRSDSVK